ncbi:MAG: DUF1028 domain-containing protein [Vicinamibacterales bacterium]|nr:DUF1028 domain-containing protein [Vicinamibacterales bacterium]
MMLRRVLTVVLLTAAMPLLAEERTSGPDPAAADPWFGTFSIIAWDPETQELGVATQSRAFGAGAAVPYAIPGVGAVATQAAANRLYGPKAVALLRQGLSPAEVVRRITDEDGGRDRRQVAVIDTQGRTGIYTGRHVIDRNSDPNDPIHLGGYAGHLTGPHYVAIGNTLASEDVVRGIARGYEQAKGSMGERLMAALEGGQAAGGDTRGMQSGGILVVRPLPDGSTSTVERIIDIRVDDAKEPFVELRRLLNITTGVPGRMTTQSEALAKAGKFAEAIAEQEKALAINPHSDRLLYALAQRRAQAGEFLRALGPLGEALAMHPAMKTQAAEDPAFEQMRGLAEFQRMVAATPARDSGGQGEPPATVDPWFGTFSIAAFDPATGEFGVATQSRAFGAGAAVPYAVAGVGAVATQASANRQYGPKAIALLQQGVAPAEIVTRISDEDEGRDSRQLIVVDATGRTGVFTGKGVSERNAARGAFAGYAAGPNYAAAGNTLAGEAVVKAMAQAYERGTGTLADRLMDALDAGQAAGGDTRGMQSGGILVVRPIPPGADSTNERIVDIRVDDARDPFVELRRLLQITQGAPARHTTRAEALSKAGRHAEAIAEQKKAIAIQPHHDRWLYALAQRYVQAGEYGAALEPLTEALAMHPNLRGQLAADPVFAPMQPFVEFQRLTVPR